MKTARQSKKTGIICSAVKNQLWSQWGNEVINYGDVYSRG